MMGGPPPGFGGPRSDAAEKLKEPKPKSLAEVPGYLKRLFVSFFSRLFYIFGLVWEAKPWILFVMVFMAIYNGVSPVLSAYIGAELLNALGESITAATTGVSISFDRILFLLIFQFGYIFFNNLIHNVYNMVIRIAGELVSNHIKLKLFEKARTIDLASFDRPEFYEKLENANREAGSRPIQILSSTFTIVSTLISMISFIVILVQISVVAPIVLILLAIPSAVISFIYRRKNFFYMRRRSKDRRQMNYYGELITGKDIVKEVRLFDLSGTFVGRYQETFKRYFGGIRSLILQEGFWHIAISAANSIVNCYLFLYIARLVYQGVLEIGYYSLYTGALNSISGGVSNLISTTATIYEGTLFIDNVIAFMNEEQTVIPRLAEPLHVKRHCGHTIELRNVSFRYPGTERMVIKNVNLTLREGETAVLVGLNGAGKTTLIKLITRLYDPTEGEIYLDGHDIRDYDLKELYAMYGIIFQDFGKYAVSVRDNIHFGDVHRELVDEEIRDAAEQSNADIFIEKLPDGFDTPLMRYFEANGIELSIGQWQKLSIARAFYSDSDVLILDEPTASLDPMAEQEIFNQFDALRKDKTTIFVSHRLSSATTASKIIVLEYGEVVEEGNHRELMEKRGKYYELFSTQAKRYVTSMEEAGAPVLPDGMPPRGGKPPHGRPPRFSEE
ncbi:MAG: ABC transporter ATP-binding protein [Ruminococcaceae bacterium]|nr:ABC transporter ATP-binding protein [Oscillospiraceae bacterium]